MKKELFSIFDNLDLLTKDKFAIIKKNLDSSMMKKYSCNENELGPHTTGDLFFQEVASELIQTNFDTLFKNLPDVVQITKEYYQKIGFNIDSILEKSSMYEQKGKSPHAFCLDVTKENDDVRILCNVKQNLQWMETCLHETGHAIYDQNIGRDVPFVLHGPSHILSTEGIAMLFGSMSTNSQFLKEILKINDEQIIKSGQEKLKIEKLIFSRWTQVMLRFEQFLYSSDSISKKTLNQKWWDLKKQYQLINPPSKEEIENGTHFAAKIHVVVAPVYYQNYMLGELYNSQLHHYISKNISKKKPSEDAFLSETESIKKHLMEKVFEPGNKLNWNQLSEFSTDEKLNPKAFAQAL